MKLNKLSNRSAKRLTGVHPLLVACVCIAMRNENAVDFSVGKDAVRTFEQQLRLFNNGKSKTMHSKHLIQKDGYSHAVDLYPSRYMSIKSIPDAVWKAVKNQMDKAAEIVGVELTHGFDWGWDKPHHQIKRIL